MTKAYLLGFIAGATGKHQSECPYEGAYWQTEREHWLAGWNDSDPHRDSLVSMEELFKSCE